MNAEAAYTPIYEPNRLEVFITLLAGKLSGRTYAEYVKRLPLAGNERVLDFGSGAGTPALYLARRLKAGGGRLTCLDISRTWIETAQRRLRGYTNVDFLLGDIRALRIPPESYDVAFLHFVLHDIPTGQRASTVAALALTLARGGRLYLREPLRFITEDEIRQLCEGSGLRLVDAATVQVPTQGTAFEGSFSR